MARSIDLNYLSGGETTMAKEKTNYYLIFHKEGEKFGSLFCVVESEAVAAQFCKDYPDFYYFARNKLM